MRKIAIIGANSFQNPLILKAKEMGFETHVFAWQDGSIGEKTADYFYPISIVEKEEILEKCREIQPEAVVTIASDLANITVQYVAEGLGLVHNSRESIEISTNKYLMRQAFAKAGVPTPKFMVEEEGQDLSEAKEMSYPVIVKPTDRSGSRGINKISSFEGLPAAIKDSVENSFQKKAIIEEYLEGEEYSCECISYKGKHHFLAVTKKYTTGAPHFIETGHLEPAKLPEGKEDKVIGQIFQALDALKIENGASHSEFKMDAEGNVKIIEIGSRMGGDCIGSDLVKISTGYDFVQMVIETALGKEPSFEPVREPKYAVIRFIFTKKDLEVLGQAVEDIVNTAYEVFDKQDMKLAEKIEPLEEVIDELSKEVKRRHVQRLRNGECTIEMGFILSDITTCLERVADHCSNIGVCVTQVNEDLYDTHSHLNIVKSHPDETFYHELEDARIKYQLS